MKRRLMVLGTAFAAGVLATVMAVSVLAAQITEEKAKAIALEHAGVRAEDVTLIKSKSDFEKGRLVYDVEFVTSDYKEYDYEIDKATGEILSWDYDAEYNFLTNNRPQENAVNNLPAAGTAAGATAGNTAGTTAGVNTAGTTTGAGNAAGTTAGVGNAAGTTAGVGNAAGMAAGTATNTAAISLEDAKAAALKYAGINAADVIWGKVELDYDDGRLLYEGKFYCGTMEYEFEVDAASGMIIDWDMESIFD